MDNSRFRFRVWEQFEDGTGRMIPWEGLYGLARQNDGEISAHVADGDQYYLFCQDKDVHLMQSTGLKDKNGKLIYEGDVVEGVHPGSLLKCGWNQSQLRWSWYWIGTDSIYCHLGQGDTDPEIIGDIHTAPELLSD
jgi:hypothetical protein